MACGPCARKRQRQQVTSLQAAAQQEAERQAQANAEALAVAAAKAIETVIADAQPLPEEPPAVKSTARKARSKG